MQYTFVKACLLALAATSSVLAQTPGFNVINAPVFDEEVPAGSTYTIKWTPSDPAAPVTLRLMQGTTNITLGFAPGFIAEGIDSALGQYEWSVPADPTFPLYGIRLQLDSDPENTFQYSHPFKITGGSGKPTGKSTTVHISEVSSSTSAAPSTSTSAPSSTKKATSTTKEPETTETATTAPSSTEAPSTTLDTATVAPTSVETTGTPSATPSSPANSNNVVGGGILGAMVMVFALF